MDLRWFLGALVVGCVPQEAPAPARVIVFAETTPSASSRPRRVPRAPSSAGLIASAASSSEVEQEVAPMYASAETGTEVARRWLGTFLVTPGEAEGPLLRQELRTQQRVLVPIPMAGQRCYAISAAVLRAWPRQINAGPESGEILLELLSPLSKPPYGRVERQAAGSQVVLDSVCNIGLVPLQFRLLVTVRRGSGTLLLQPFSHPKPERRIRMTLP
jgi:hypothetical protein